MRVLTPTENNRLNELIGFLGVMIAVLIALALLSYSPHDPSFNVSTDSPDMRAARNWIGPVGAYSADLFFQGFGYAAFLLPVGIFLLGYRWFRSEPIDSPAIKLAGYSMLVLMAPTMLTLWHVPEVRGAIPPGGLLGHLVSEGLRVAFSTVGANLVALAIFFAALFLTTRFSFIETHEWLRGPLSKLNVIGPLKERYWTWREDREQERMRKRLEQIKMEGRPPIPSYAAATPDLLVDVRAGAQAVVLVGMSRLRREETPEGLEAALAALGRRRAGQGIPLPDVLLAFQVGAHRFWQHIVELAPEAPEERPYGIDAGFRDPSGNQARMMQST